MKETSEEVDGSGSELDLAGFEAERDRVCTYFAEREGKRQPGQLTNVEYIFVGVLLVVTFALVLVFQ
ncbi:hypothetical protein [Paeniglutamicibacter kerguelensis]|uniref:Uncharacterized protein n=1 Tax=Paeniglutamicibacter kerguelensis TaxID=254788 RepID=A0ABS4XF85_9MICC|nr:hypothetical protein [Paeniglutamicibacter kerguelensis]MBP2387126.1 hypothetical protein [Paeniglutamicibacter kerguelensis]